MNTRVVDVPCSLYAYILLRIIDMIFASLVLQVNAFALLCVASALCMCILLLEMAAMRFHSTAVSLLRRCLALHNHFVGFVEF